VALTAAYRYPSVDIASKTRYDDPPPLANSEGHNYGEEEESMGSEESSVRVGRGEGVVHGTPTLYVFGQ
jgi:hypothetical protein